MANITKKHISAGISWVAIEKADVYICCGCPADAVKHLKKAGLINSIFIDGTRCENGPNSILLSDTLIQNGQIANLTEFPILQMLYMQGYNLLKHPNYKKNKPILIGYEEQIKAQLEYVSVGNHGLKTIEEIVETGISKEDARKIFATKLHYAGGEIKSMSDLIDSRVLADGKKEIKNGVFIQRLGINKFKISYEDEHVFVDLNLAPQEHFRAPYELPFRDVKPGKLSITHTGEGNGWDKERPCMASIMHHEGRYYLIDAGPNILNNLSHLGIGLSEIDGIFLSHIHDDHFAGITELLNVERKLNFYATKLIRKTAENKLNALMNSEMDLLHIAFNCIDLEYDIWNDVNGLEVKPIHSPHTVETSVFFIRAKDVDGYKTYAHLSDTINLTAFKNIVDSSKDIFSKEDFSKVEKNYLQKVNLKKIDVGGGAIHGHLKDYKHDHSDLVVMAHTAIELKSAKHNFTNVDFGETHTLIKDDGLGFLYSKQKTYLKRYFNTLEEEEIDILASMKIHRYEPGEVVLSKNQDKKLVLIISGLVSSKNDSGKTQLLDAGNFIGFTRRYFRHILPEFYEAWSYVYCIEYDEDYMNQFIRSHSLIDDINSRINLIKIFRQSTLISDVLSYAIYNRFGKYASLIDAQSYDLTEDNLSDNLFIIINGEVTIIFEDKSNICIGTNEHFGGFSLVKKQRRKQIFKFSKQLQAVCIPVAKLVNVPILLWRLIELEEKRYQLSIFKDE